MTGRRRRPHLVGALAALLLLGTTLAACGPGAGASTIPGIINAVGAENQYADVISQIGGRYVHVTALLDNPSTDPHSFEASPRVAQYISAARLIVQNGLGYDTFMNRIESATPHHGRQVIVVQNLLGLPNSTPNPHLWYAPATMPKVVTAIASALTTLQPAHAAFFQANVNTFDSSLQPWLTAIGRFKADHPGTTAATTEPVADALLEAMGIDNLTPFGFQADIMNGVDPSPQDIALEDGFFAADQVKVFCYNQQVVDALTGSIRQAAHRAGIPVVGVYETMPAPGYDYQSWMLAETEAIEQAVSSGRSTEQL